MSSTQGIDFSQDLSAQTPTISLIASYNATNVNHQPIDRDGHLLNTTPDIYLGEGHAEHPVKDLEEAFELVTDAEPIARRMREAKIRDPQRALEKGVINETELQFLGKVRAAVDRVIAVDAFPMEAVSPLAAQHRRPVAPSGGVARAAEAAE